MRIAAVQIEVQDKDIDFNIQQHIKACKKAAEHEVSLIIFPEMSLTGYLREGASEFAFSENDERLLTIKSSAKEHNQIIVVGAPVTIKNSLYIGEFIIFPGGRIQIYTKQYLHKGEEVVFDSSFKYNPQIELGDELISLAICADVENSQHPEEAKKNGATLYLASVFYLDTSMEDLHSKLSKYAKNHSMNILLSNFIGKSFNYNAGGLCAFWNKTGRLIDNTNPEGNRLLIIEKKKSEWTGLNKSPITF